MSSNPNEQLTDSTSTKDRDKGKWLTPGVWGIGLASFLADVGHEVPTSLFASFLVSTLGASAAVLGLIEGIADGAAGFARLAGGVLADEPARRRSTAIGGIHKYSSAGCTYRCCFCHMASRGVTCCSLV